MSDKGWTVEECAAALRAGDDPLTVLRYAVAAEKARADAAEAELKSVEAARRREMARNDVQMRSSLREYEEQAKALASARRECEAAKAALRLCIDWMPKAEVRSWPPGFRLRDEALKAARAALAAHADVPK